MTDLRRIGPIYSLGDSTRLQDLDGGCGSCGKRLSEVVHDPHGQWRAGAIVCVDCGTEARESNPRHQVTVKASYRARGSFIALCSCRWTSMPTGKARAVEWANKHRQDAA